MFRINLPFSDGSVLLAPQLGTLPRWLQAFLLALALGALFVIVLWLYRYELHYVPRRYARGLLGLRLLIVGAIFTVLALQPSIRYVARERIPAHVLVAVDRSESMNVADPQRRPIEKLELARGLKLAADLADDDAIAGWIERLRKAETPTEPAYRRLIERVDGLPRRAIAERVLAPEGADLFKALSERHQLEFVAFDQRLGQLPHNFESIRAILAANGKKAAEAGTDLNLPLRHGLELRDDLKEGLIGIVVLSDGQHNWGGIPGELAHQLGHTENKPSVPVYALVCGAKVPPADLAIASARATPPIVFKHGAANVDVRLLANNLPAGQFKITVAYPEAPDLPPRLPIVEFVDFDGVNQPPPRTIPVKMDRAAAERLTVTVEAVGKDGRKIDDRFPENNTRQVVVHVAPDKAKVLIVDGEARWEEYYLQTALRRDPSMETGSVVFDQPRLNLVREEDMSALNLPDLRLPGPTELPRFDCIILGDVAPEHLPEADRVRLEKFVADRGGTLVILAGKRSMPLAFMGPNDPIGRMVPIANPHMLSRPGGFRATLTAEGAQTGFLRLEAESAASEERWTNLPPHYWAIVGTAKPAAVPLAYVPPADRSAAAPDERSNALFVRQKYGFGQVVYIGLDSTWRWRFKQGDKYHHRFWSQVIRWAASDRALIAGNDFIRFGVREPVYRGDQEVEMLARLGDKARRLDRDTLIGARLLRQTAAGNREESAALIALKPSPEIPGQYEGTQANLPPGDYQMVIVGPDLDGKLNGPDGKKLSASFKVLPPDSGEMLNLATNWERMKELADKSGGAMLPAERAGELIEKLKDRTATRELTTDKRLGQSWWLLIPLIALLTAEWLLRKWVGLA